MLPNFNEILKKYAHLIIKSAINVQKNQTVVLHIDVEQRALAHLLIQEAYSNGANEVIVKWSDDITLKEFLEHADETTITTIPESRKVEITEWLDKSVSRISVVSADPDALGHVDPKRISAYQTAVGQANMPLRKATQANKNSWTVVAAAGSAWAKKVFPQLETSEEQVDALWDMIFKTTRVYTENPVAAWEAHDEHLESLAEKLNRENFKALHYTAPGTDFTVGLAKNHLWEGAGSLNSRGEKFMANMPTEEVFTAPDANYAEGTVSSTKPLSYAGVTIEGMKFTFKDGKVIEATAEKGEDTLKRLLDTDEGAKHLGEVALVPDPTPISQSGITFFNTLFDENASCHLAVGSAYAFNIKDGTKMNEEELKAAGLNRSQTHVDFMIGSNEMDIDGIREDGTHVPIFRKGDWA